MKNAAAMGVLDGACHFRHERYALPRVVAQRGRDLLQSSTRCELHAEEWQAVFALAYFIDGKDVRMIKAPRGLGFAPKTSQGFARIGVITQDPFHGDDPAGGPLTRPTNHAHPPD